MPPPLSEAVSVPPPLETPPPILTGNPQPARRNDFLAMVLSLSLGLFLADATISLLDDGLAAILSGRHPLAVVRGLIGLPSFFVQALVYLLMAFVPTIPKRYFLPVTLFDPVSALVLMFLMVYFFAHLQQITLFFSLAQLILGLAILCRLQGGFKLQWPLVPPGKLNYRPFSGGNLAGFALVNLLVLLPGAILSVGLCASLAVGHFSEGFMALGWNGISVIEKKYVRDDGKTIQLYPMAHVGEADFYDNISRAFPTNGIVLMEGVTDEDHLLTNKLSYKKMAQSLGLSEQKETFAPKPGQSVRADVDINQFSKTTIDFLNFATMFHSKGVNSETIAKMSQYAPKPGLDQILIHDLLTMRNAHLMEEIKSHLKGSDHLVVPWGAAHMPGISHEVEKLGFHAAESNRYVVIAFGHHAAKKSVEKKSESSDEKK